MDMLLKLLVLSLLGLCFGSFVNALVWRLKKKRDFVKERSECTHCHHILAWYDLIPVVSWLMLRAKCRYCHKKIDDSPLTELAVALAFIISYILWPLGFSTAGWALFVLWLIALVLLAALFLYDLKWFLLPNVLMFPLIGIGVVWAVVYYTFVSPEPLLVVLQNVALGIASVAGLYGALYYVSQGEWVGFGDVKLGIFMGLVLGWQHGLLAVLLANVLAFVVIAPGFNVSSWLRRLTSRSSSLPSLL
jgi:prepilin signal peptidase PulO-like enzyme (type II secretory pathway)